MMTCREVCDYLSDYLEDELPPAERAAFEQHLQDCRTCRDYLDSYRKTIELGRQAFDSGPQNDPVPPELVEAVLAARRKRVQQQSGS